MNERSPQWLYEMRPGQVVTQNSERPASRIREGRISVEFAAGGAICDDGGDSEPIIRLKP